MKAVIIDTFNNYELRTKHVFNILIGLGYDTTIISSDFCHTLKSEIKEVRENTIYIPTKRYKKNLSLKRIRSHLDFSKKAYIQLCAIKPDLIYSIIPLNSLLPKIHKYVKKNKVKVIVDIFDLWPESMPKGDIIRKVLFPWRNMRDKHLKIADAVFLECSYYKKFLPSDCNFVTAYLCKEYRSIEYVGKPDVLNFLYLGSINNIIDIDGMVSFLTKVNQRRKVCLNIIGVGEAKEELKKQLENAGIAFVDYGAVYDDEEKDRIIKNCRFGINMYKKGLCIGLTMKSLDYFSRGLPIINNNIFDTAQIIDECACGVNVTGEQCAIDTVCSVTEQDWRKMHDSVKLAYEKYFSVGTYENLLRKTFKDLL